MEGLVLRTPYRRDLIMSADLTNPSHSLPQPGERVSTVELDLSSFMATLDEERIDKMARAYTQGSERDSFAMEKISF
ncbi:MAG: hypothetical protein ACLR23_00475 [Clostridia bacterium]